MSVSRASGGPAGLRGRELSVRVRGRRVLDGVSVTVSGNLSGDLQRGEVVAVLGPNGAGKSTLLRAMAGLVPLDGGAVTLDGAPLPPPRVLARRAAALWQEAPVGVGLTVREVVTLGARAGDGTLGPSGPGGGLAALVDAALAAMDLAGLADRPVDRLSGGERQRVGLARCLAVGAPYLLLDEPSNHLDLLGRARLLALLGRRERSVLLATHDPALALVADRVLVLEGGRLVAEGPPVTVLTPGRLAATFGVRAHLLFDPLDGAPLLRLLPADPPAAPAAP